MEDTNFEKLITQLRDKLDDSTKGRVSEELLAITGQLRGQQEELNTRQKQINKLTDENKELLLTNGKLFNKIGFEKKEEEKDLFEEVDEIIKIEDIIDSKGNFI